jgi:hypothetical protein
MSNKSESIKELASALAKAQGEFEHAKKDVKNAFFKTNYADLASCMDAAKKPLSNNGLSVTQLTDYDESGKLYLNTILMHSSGEWLSGRYPINPVKNDPQGVGSAITYARRYAFSAITGIAADDDDGNAASGNKEKQNQPTVDISYLKTQILNAPSIAELQTVWSTVPKELQPQLTPDKDLRKQQLAPKAA